ncbi:MAG: hypothetical protein ACRD2J_01965 [Thermoanaerobaculia bacterium]
MPFSQSWRGLIVLLLFASVSFGEAPLFPTPLHLTREIDDPVTGRTFTVEEYFVRNRSVAIHGDRVAIADYENGELIRIDRAAATWSRTSFEAIARANADLRPRPRAGSSASASASAGAGVRFAGRERRRGRDVEVFRGDSGEGREIEIAVDRSVLFGRDAVEIVLGAAYPFEPSLETAAILSASRGGEIAAAADANGDARAFALPVETIVVDRSRPGAEARSANRIVRIEADLPPPDLLLIPPGARRIEDQWVTAARMLDALDRLPSEVAPENPR